MKFACEWLPDLVDFNDYGDWTRYEDILYSIFYQDFVATQQLINNKPVNYRKHPYECDKEQAFFHLTSVDYHKTQDPSNRIPDLRRCERIRWIKALIHNWNCPSGIVKIWREPYKSYERLHFLIEEERYLLVIEERKNYFLLITAYYLDRDHELKKKLKKYNKYKQKTPL
ncbi:hypothetical protein [Evansella cellulosilytica]|uniref:Phage P1-related protein n=1 Tax=Evansella cellulosilytica (strain ATCC 21833 / DSM 2522 / FERM P-1141 / JCM 9156 / N-4) TaxID=649639 RepID=E6TVF7_EVAC2|nr:hypothetical protein [Evansella cellulosilytica]ADU30974.1 phage P1-related protein [Evansella cellulosilytica DSM 2522]